MDQTSQLFQHGFICRLTFITSPDPSYAHFQHQITFNPLTVLQCRGTGTGGDRSAVPPYLRIICCFPFKAYVHFHSAPTSHGLHLLLWLTQVTGSLVLPRDTSAISLARGYTMSPLV